MSSEYRFSFPSNDQSYLHQSFVEKTNNLIGQKLCEIADSIRSLTYKDCSQSIEIIMKHVVWYIRNYEDGQIDEQGLSGKINEELHKTQDLKSTMSSSELQTLCHLIDEVLKQPEYVQVRTDTFESKHDLSFTKVDFVQIAQTYKGLRYFKKQADVVYELSQQFNRLIDSFSELSELASRVNSKDDKKEALQQEYSKGKEIARELSTTSKRLFGLSKYFYISEIHATTKFMSLDDANEFIRECKDYESREKELPKINADEVLEAFEHDLSQVIDDQIYRMIWSKILNDCIQRSRLEPTRQVDVRIHDTSLPRLLTLQDSLTKSNTPVIRDWISRQQKLVPLNAQLEPILDVRINDKQVFVTVTLMLGDPDELTLDSLLLNNTLVSEHPECIDKSIDTLISEYGLAYDEHIIVTFEYKLP